VVLAGQTSFPEFTSGWSYSGGTVTDSHRVPLSTPPNAILMLFYQFSDLKSTTVAAIAKQQVAGAF
jgi:hypothetical protein